MANDDNPRPKRPVPGRIDRSVIDNDDGVRLLRVSLQRIDRPLTISASSSVRRHQAYGCGPIRAYVLIARRDVAGKPVPHAAKTCVDLSSVVPRSQQEIHCQFKYRPEYAANQPGAPLCEIVEREIEHVAAHIVAPDRRKLVESGGSEAKLEIGWVQARGATNIVVQDSLLVDKPGVPGLHQAIAIFEFAPIQDIVRIGQTDPTHSGQAVEASRPNGDLAAVMAFPRPRFDYGEAIPSERGAMVGLIISLVASETGEKGHLVLETPR